MKYENYITIQGWMVSELKLSGNNLLTFALIYGFCQDGESEFKGSINYICKWLNCSRPTAIKSLKYLCENNLIIKTVKNINDVNFNRYKVNLLVVKKLNIGSKETLLGSKETLHAGSKETLPNNNILDNNNNNNIINFDKLLSFINSKTGRNFKVINERTKKKYNARLKEGYTKQDILDAVSNSIKSDFHKEKNFKYLTPEFFSRSETLDKYSNTNNKPKENNVKSLIPKGVSYSGPQY